MNKVYLLLILFLLQLNSSCSHRHISYEERESTFEEDVQLLDSNLYKNNFLAVVHTKGNYEIRVPFPILHNYIDAEANKYTDKALYEFSKDIVKFMDENKSKIYTYPELNMDGGDISIWRIFKFFEEGDYLVFDKLKNAYVDKVYTKTYSWYAGPLSASFSIEIKIGDFLLYVYDAQA